MSPLPGGAQEATPAPSQTLPEITFGGLLYLTYEDYEREDSRTSQFFIRRAYLTTSIQILPRLSGRLTFDTSQDKEGDGRGDMEVRLKYAYAKYALGDWGLLRRLAVEGGIVHMVWLDFEEHINLYRMRAPMFMERSGIFNSADFGVTLGGGLGPELSQDELQSVGSAYRARYGSFAIGLYNGTGYHGDERNRDKVAQGRLTLRPLPAFLPGLQVSGLAILGKGNRSPESGPIPDWRTHNLFVSYQDRRGTLTGQYIWGKGNQSGTWTIPETSGQAGEYTGFALFGEGRLGPNWRIVGGYDRMRRRTPAENLGFVRVHGGVGYDLGNQNVLLVDLHQRDWEHPDRGTETGVQVVFQVKF